MHMIKISFTGEVFNINTVFLKPELSLRKEKKVFCHNSQGERTFSSYLI